MDLGCALFKGVLHVDHSSQLRNVDFDSFRRIARLL